MDITLKTKKALEYLTVNRDNHIAEYKDQFRGWREAMSGYSDELKAWAISTGPEEEKPKELERPRNYLKQYEDLIIKLNEHILDNITLNDSEFEKIVKDNFHWTQSFRSRTPIYTLGNPDPKSFSRGKKIESQEYPGDISGSLGSNRLSDGDHIHIEVD